MDHCDTTSAAVNPDEFLAHLREKFVAEHLELPAAGVDPYDRPGAELHLLATPLPLDGCDTWEGALDVARSLGEGALEGKASVNADFWDAPASRLVAVAMWVVGKRGCGSPLVDALELLSAASAGQTEDTGGDPGVAGSWVKAFAAEVDYCLAEAALEEVDAGRSASDAQLAHRAIAVHGAAAGVTVWGIRRAAIRALTAALAAEGLTGSRAR